MTTIIKIIESPELKSNDVFFIEILLNNLTFTKPDFNKNSEVYLTFQDIVDENVFNYLIFRPFHSSGLKT